MRIKIVYNRYKVTGEAPVHLDVVFNRTERIYLHTGVRVYPDHWDSKNNKVKKGNPQFTALNIMIQNLINKVQNWERVSLEKGKEVSKKNLQAFILGKDQAVTLSAYMEEMLEAERKRLASETIRQRESVIRNMVNFQPTTLADINSNWLADYHQHLLTTMKESSTGKNHKFVKRAIVKANRAGLISNNPYEQFRIPEAGKRVVFLTTDELKNVRNYTGVARLEKVRDLFLFQCLTGVSYSDMQALNPSHFFPAENPYIAHKRQKTGQYYIIPLLPEAVQLINRYATTEKLFPGISNQKMNGYLKEIQTITGINKPLTTHVARHTFATLMLSRGLPLESVSHILGHSSTRITQVYAKVVLEKLQADFSRLNINSL